MPTVDDNIGLTREVVSSLVTGLAAPATSTRDRAFSLGRDSGAGSSRLEAPANRHRVMDLEREVRAALDSATLQPAFVSDGSLSQGRSAAEIGGQSIWSITGLNPTNVISTPRDARAETADSALVPRQRIRMDAPRRDQMHDIPDPVGQHFAGVTRTPQFASGNVAHAPDLHSFVRAQLPFTGYTPAWQATEMPQVFPEVGSVNWAFAKSLGYGHSAHGADDGQPVFIDAIKLVVADLNGERYPLLPMPLTFPDEKIASLDAAFRRVVGDRAAEAVDEQENQPSEDDPSYQGEPVGSCKCKIAVSLDKLTEKEFAEAPDQEVLHGRFRPDSALFVRFAISGGDEPKAPWRISLHREGSNEDIAATAISAYPGDNRGRAAAMGSTVPTAKAPLSGTEACPFSKDFWIALKLPSDTEGTYRIIGTWGKLQCQQKLLIGPEYARPGELPPCTCTFSCLDSGGSLQTSCDVVIDPDEFQAGIVPGKIPTGQVELELDAALPRDHAWRIYPKTGDLVFTAAEGPETQKITVTDHEVSGSECPTKVRATFRPTEAVVQELLARAVKGNTKPVTAILVAEAGGKPCGQVDINVRLPGCSCAEAVFNSPIPEDHSDYYIGPGSPGDMDPARSRVVFVRNASLAGGARWETEPSLTPTGGNAVLQIDVHLRGLDKQRHRLLAYATDSSGKHSTLVRFAKAESVQGEHVDAWYKSASDFDDRSVKCADQPVRVGVEVQAQSVGTALRRLVQNARRERRDPGNLSITLKVHIVFDGEECAALELRFEPGTALVRSMDVDTNKPAIENRDEADKEDIQWPLRVETGESFGYRKLVIERLRAVCPGGQVYVAEDNTIRTRRSNCRSGLMGLPHPGCKLLADLVCKRESRDTQCKVTISSRTGSNPGYVPDDAPDATAQGDPVMSVWYGQEKQIGNGVGTGKGSGGTVFITSGDLSTGVRFRFWRLELGGAEWVPTTRIAVEGPAGGSRFLIHELAHALNGCNGNTQFTKGDAGREQDFRAYTGQGTREKRPTFAGATIRDQTNVSPRQLHDVYHNVEEFLAIQMENEVLWPIFGGRALPGHPGVLWSPRFSHG